MHRDEWVLCGSFHLHVALVVDRGERQPGVWLELRLDVLGWLLESAAAEVFSIRGLLVRPGGTRTANPISAKHESARDVGMCGAVRTLSESGSPPPAGWPGCSATQWTPTAGYLVSWRRSEHRLGTLAAAQSAQRAWAKLPVRTHEALGGRRTSILVVSMAFCFSSSSGSVPGGLSFPLSDRKAGAAPPTAASGAGGGLCRLLGATMVMSLGFWGGDAFRFCPDALGREGAPAALAFEDAGACLAATALRAGLSVNGGEPRGLARFDRVDGMAPSDGRHRGVGGRRRSVVRAPLFFK